MQAFFSLPSSTTLASMEQPFEWISKHSPSHRRPPKWGPTALVCEGNTKSRIFASKRSSYREHGFRPCSWPVVGLGQGSKNRARERARLLPPGHLKTSSPVGMLAAAAFSIKSRSSVKFSAPTMTIKTLIPMPNNEMGVDGYSSDAWYEPP